MVEQTIKVELISPLIGAEIYGIDISKPLGNDKLTEIHNALMTYQVIFFRDQEISLAQHKRFCRNFGDLHIHPTAIVMERHREIITIDSDKNSKTVAGMKWHSDVSCDVEPPMGSILHLHQIPEIGWIPCFQVCMLPIMACQSQ